MRNNIKTIVICLSIILAAVYLSFKDSSKYAEIREKGDVYICEITRNGGDVFCDVSFNGNNKRLIRSKPYSTIENGELFKVYHYYKYDDLFYIAYDEPIVDLSKFIEIKPLVFKEKGGFVYFEYVVGDVEYEKFQETKFDLDSLDFSTYKIYYKMNKPSIAYALKDN